ECRFTIKLRPQSNRQWPRRALLPNQHQATARRFRVGRARFGTDMLDTLRSAAGTWVAKALLFLLVVSFAIWGISGRMISGFGSPHVVEVGGTTVSVSDYRLAYNREMRLLSQQFGTQLTQEQAKALGIDQRVLQQLVRDALLDEEARDLGLGVS